MPPSNYVPKLVQVPAEPGPLVPYTAPASSRSAGAPASGRSSSDAFPVSALDLAVLFIGAAVLVWGLAVGAPAFVLVVASVVTVVGFLLPLRKLARRRSRPVGSLRVADDGVPSGEEPLLLLDLADPTSNRLTGAYRRLLVTVAGRDDLVALEAAAAAHAAIGEAAALVEGRPPVSLADLDQLDQRSEAMERLATLLAARRVGALSLPPIAPADDGLARLRALVVAFA